MLVVMGDRVQETAGNDSPKLSLREGVQCLLVRRARFRHSLDVRMSRENEQAKSQTCSVLEMCTLECCSV